MLRILTYHRVAAPEATPHLNPRLVSATPGAFEKQAEWLARRYRVVGMEQVLDALAGRQRLPRRALLLTFDDAYRDFGSIAWPVLRRLSLPATLFVPTRFPDQPERTFWADRLFRAFGCARRSGVDVEGLGRLCLRGARERASALRRLQAHVKALTHAEAEALVDRICDELLPPSGADAGRPLPHSVLSWDELRELSREGVAIGAHSRSHALLGRLPARAVREEVRGSQDDLRRELGETLPIFCYPSGSHGETSVRILREEGVRAAFTTLDGHNDLRKADPLRLRRTNVTRRTTVRILRLRLLWFAGHLDAWRHRGESRATLAPAVATGS